jgi:hypothetical protein
MDNLTNLAGATHNQQEFITSLLRKRDYTLGDVVINTPQEASALIKELLAAPLLPRAVYTPPVRDEELFEALSSVQKSFYALPTSELFLDVMDEKISGDLLFVQVREYEKTLYLRRLHGSVGGFTRTKMSRKDSLIILRKIAEDSYKYSRAFGEHYQCCGKCGAELTDAQSRKLMLGPTCRKVFGR